NNCCAKNKRGRETEETEGSIGQQRHDELEGIINHFLSTDSEHDIQWLTQIYNLPFFWDSSG
ncbi:hypothetical protein ACJX0J_006992, partial [Zea mays]